MQTSELGARIRDVPDFPKPGILFKDITTLLKDGDGFKAAVDGLLAKIGDKKVDAVVGMESRGFIFAAPIRYKLGWASSRSASWASCRRRGECRVRPRIRLGALESTRTQSNRARV